MLFIIINSSLLVTHKGDYRHAVASRYYLMTRVLSATEVVILLIYGECKFPTRAYELTLSLFINRGRKANVLSER